jgi:hypothetical protein
MVQDDDITATAKLPEIENEGSDFEMEEGWDKI